ncbi:MAG: lipopolysaccharide transport system permease protein [Acidobacteriota bacterium]|jgi:ABC-type polysaccharide/polyol phosphate export permease|nr:lipopolysaccharide transport system permease protein [Acidobacteriota bacterium]
MNDVRHHLFLLRELVKRDFQGRYAGSLLGFVWSFVQPLWMLVLFTFVFSTVMRVRLAGGPTHHFSVFLFSGLLPWMALQEGVLRSSTAVTDNASLVKKLRFPAEILVLAVVLAALLHEAIAAVIFLGVVAVLGDLSWRGLPFLFLALPLQIALTVGLGLLLGSVHVFFRDTAQLLGMVFTGWFYLTPIVYPIESVPSRFLPWIRANPLTALVGLYRQALLGAAPTGGTGVLVAAAAVLLSAGFWLFSRLKPAFVDEI